MTGLILSDGNRRHLSLAAHAWLAALWWRIGRQAIHNRSTSYDDGIRSFAG